jgi:hypothetical protein
LIQSLKLPLRTDEGHRRQPAADVAEITVPRATTQPGTEAYQKDLVAFGAQIDRHRLEAVRGRVELHDGLVALRAISSDAQRNCGRYTLSVAARRKETGRSAYNRHRTNAGRAGTTSPAPTVSLDDATLRDNVVGARLVPARPVPEGRG